MRAIVVVAHADDETIGAGGHLASLAPILVVHVTDGAPRDPRLRSSALAALPREDYAAVRRGEVERALEIAGIPAARVLCLGAIDQEAVFEAAGLARSLGGIFDELRPTLVLTHPYEGGHPDHDATALVVAAAVRRTRPGVIKPCVLEMASYHAGEGQFTANTFLPNPSPQWTAELSPERAAQKRAMFHCFASQSEVLSSFGVAREAFRVAPRYDFSRPPHEGSLHYERLGWPMDGKRFCEIGADALAELAGDVR